MPGRPAALKDRDGCLTEEPGSVNPPSRLRLLPGTPSALRRLGREGVPAIMVTGRDVKPEEFLVDLLDAADCALGGGAG